MVEAAHHPSLQIRPRRHMEHQAGEEAGDHANRPRAAQEEQDATGIHHQEQWAAQGQGRGV